MLRRYY